MFQHLANYASENLEAMNPPLFLRFLNLLMNDAIFLLDEAIQVWGILCSLSSVHAKHPFPLHYCMRNKVFLVPSAYLDYWVL